MALEVRLDDFKRLWQMPKSAIAGILAQFVALPFITFLLVILLDPQPSIALGMMLVAACPGGNISNFMTAFGKGNVALSVSLTAFSTMAAALLTPLNFGFWASQYPPTAQLLRTVVVDGQSLVLVIALTLIVPLFLGMWFRHRFQKQALQLKKWIKPISIVIFIAFVALAFTNNMDIFLNYFHLIVYLVLLHNGLAFLCGNFMARLFNLSRYDRRAVTMETGIQNSGLGLLLIFSFFDGLGGMAMITAWWGIWHIISGLLLSTYWSRRTIVQAI